MSLRDHDLGALTAGLLFVVLGFVFLLDRLGVWEARPSVILPTMVIGVGAAVLLGALLRTGHEREQD